ERPAVRRGGVGEQALEGGFDGAFVGDVLLGVGAKCLVVALDGLVGRLEERGAGHERRYLRRGTGRILTGRQAGGHSEFWACCSPPLYDCPAIRGRTVKERKPATGPEILPFFR